MIESPVPSTYLADIITTKFDDTHARHVAQLRLTAHGNVSMMMTCHANLPKGAATRQLHSELLADATRQLTRLPEHRRRTPPQLVFDNAHRVDAQADRD